MSISWRYTHYGGDDIFLPLRCQLTVLKALICLLSLLLATSCCLGDNSLCSALLQSDIGNEISASNSGPRF